MKQGWALILIPGVCILVYFNSLENSFHYDDEHSIQNNIHLRALGNIPTFFVDPATFSRDADKGMYRPLLLLTYALNYAWGGYEVLGYHVVNLFLHALNACLVWWLVCAMHDRREVALLAGLLFALHPLGSEPVNYISSRSESLAAVFYLLGMAAFISGGHQQKGRILALSWVALALGLLSKSTVITLPAVLLIYDYLFISGRKLPALWRCFLRRHAPYWGIAVGYLILISANGFFTNSIRSPVRDGWTQLLTQIKAFAYYLQLLFWPLRLNVEHQFFEQREFQGVAMFGALLLVLSCAGLLFYLYRRRCDRPLFLFLWGILALLPVMVMPLNVLVNERRLYISCAAFCIGLALMLRSEKARRYSLIGRDFGWGLGVLILLGYGGLIFNRNQVWADDFSLWTDAAEKAPRMPRVFLYMGNAHKDAALRQRDQKKVQGHWQQARRSYQRTIELDPKSDLALRALNNLGSVNFVLEDYDAAEENYRRAVDLNPQYADALVNLGNIYHQRFVDGEKTDVGREQLEQSIYFYRRALEILPNHAFAYANMGLSYYHLGDFQQAEKAYDRAYFLNPRDERLLNNMGNLFAILGQRTQGENGRKYLLRAREFYLQSRRINPAYSSPLRSLQHIEQLLNSGR